MNVLRDLSLLQVQLKDYAGFAESRMKIMQHRPTELVNWTSYMVAVYLTGDYKTALEVFDTIE
jgi:tetratricopeptide (TPR) repeat protein|tara:strand:+ start:553 stop:741 length:189 start_codon:yes stop_codon:yes gene_type:complete